eukprot:CAMPEP_0198332016 /NCGR_PEP_ID=MMETSP1450-20131203/17993_1 /TAXON_ID=753684 ORGANISM="Madagascaria erythrocladiodes, Strain CCMP3234" /NCGR_SAMPLE_ID=MMETSP1450 /ASSEMBLY_ACC=CAM_ASM_001115 /LENGTH=46 /DNA_ID= /DNA_START= /DNA_END= /DNA_ORIENTATION=
MSATERVQQRKADFKAVASAGDASRRRRELSDSIRKNKRVQQRKAD